jgi:uncharacterized membrane protein YhhN
MIVLLLVKPFAMNLIKKYGIQLFGIVLLAHLFFIYTDNADLRIVSKLLLLPLLALYLYASAEKAGRNMNLPAFAGLFFSFLGDLLLTQTGELYFLLGMAAFIGTHISNSIYFLKLQPLSLKKGGAALIAALLLTFISGAVIGKIGLVLGSFKVPIIVYMLIISCMAIFAANTYNHTILKNLAIRYFIPGAVLFVMSDGILALNKFYYHEQMLDLAVMLTYGLSQCLLVTGFSRRAGNR